MSKAISVVVMSVDSLAEEETFDYWLSQLPEWRRQHILTYQNRQDQCRSLGASIILSDALKKQGLAWPEKPYLQGEKWDFYQGVPFHFSISHSDDYSAVAMSPWEIGFDLQKIKSVNVDGLWQRMSRSQSIPPIKGETRKEREADFFRIWCLWEAKRKLPAGTGSGWSAQIFPGYAAGVLTVEAGEKACIHTKQLHLDHRKVSYEPLDILWQS